MIARTCDIVRANYKQWRYQVRKLVLETLRKSKKPLTVGELFLTTEVSHTLLSRLLQELRDDNLVECHLGVTRSYTASGSSFEHQAMQWSAISNSKKGK